MGQKEKLAKEYANWRHKEVEEYLRQKCDPKDMYYRNGDIIGAFEAGWDSALSNQWISTNDRLPDFDEDVMVVDDTGSVYFCHRSNNNMVKTDNNGWCKYTDDAIIAWMYVPSYANCIKEDKAIFSQVVESVKQDKDISPELREILAKVAERIKCSKPMPSEFSKIIDEEFWNLV